MIEMMVWSILIQKHSMALNNSMFSYKKKYATILSLCNFVLHLLFCRQRCKSVSSYLPFKANGVRYMK